mgnify:CR=1 FL=1
MPPIRIRHIHHTRDRFGTAPGMRNLRGRVLDATWSEAHGCYRAKLPGALVLHLDPRDVEPAADVLTYTQPRGFVG